MRQSVEELSTIFSRIKDMTNSAVFLSGLNVGEPQIDDCCRLRVATRKLI
jgi:hypothetical protein